MTIKEVARMLGTDARRLERMAQRGDIPCQKVGGQLRFNRAEITQWLQQEMGSMSGDHLAEVDAGITAQRQARRNEAIITPLLRPEAVTAHLDARSKNGTLRRLVALAEETGLVYDGQTLLEAVVDREELCSTAIEGSIAIPHPRHPLPYALAEPVLVVARTIQPILFGAPDGRLTRLFFLTASQDDRHHLHVLARLCRMLHDSRWVDRLEAVETPEEIVELLTQREREVIAPSA
jgi:PTS system nitrogen regulatory IIA component